MYKVVAIGKGLTLSVELQFSRKADAYRAANTLCKKDRSHVEVLQWLCDDWQDIRYYDFILGKVRITDWVD